MLWVDGKSSEMQLMEVSQMQLVYAVWEVKLNAMGGWEVKFNAMGGYSQEVKSNALGGCEIESNTMGYAIGRWEAGDGCGGIGMLQLCGCACSVSQL